MKKPGKHYEYFSRAVFPTIYPRKNDVDTIFVLATPLVEFGRHFQSTKIETIDESREIFKFLQ